MAREFKDWRGTPITEGATVVYPSRQGSQLWMSEGVVAHLPLTRKSSSIAVRRKGSKRLSYPDPNRITVIP